MTLDLDAIESRARRADEKGWYEGSAELQDLIDVDIPSLIAEVRRLQAQLDRCLRDWPDAPVAGCPTDG